MPQIIEEPDLIRCEHAKRKGWPSTFRLGSHICVKCDRVRCEFHPPRAKPVICIPQEQPEVIQSSVVTRVEPIFKPKTQVSPKDLTPEEVLENFPSPTLRPYQKDIVVSVVEAFRAGKKCVILAAPTGFGKSYVNAAFTSVTRSFYATPQLALIDQIMRDPYVRSRFVEIRGRRNYQCFLQPDRRVHVGKCITEDYPCKERFDVCPYWRRKMAALNAPSVLTSLAYLISEGQTEGSESYLGTRTLLVLDEAHNLEEQCLNHVSVRVNPFSIPHEVFNQILPELLETHTDADVRSLLESIEARLNMMLERCEKIAQTTGLSTIQAEDLERTRHYLANYQLYKKSKSEWVWQVKNDELLVQPVFGKEFMRDLVWKRGEYYIISSATILDPDEFAESTGLLNFLKADEISFLTVPSTFPVENRPIIDATVGPLSAQYLATNMPKAIRAVEEILRKEKGNVAIHCHSYQHQRNLLDGISEDLKPRVIVHTSRDREEKLNEWMRSRGKVFVSVAFNEGQDWKYDLCDAQILLKVPFPDLGDMRVKKRLELGKRGWYDNRAMLEVIQAYGRAIRAEDDTARFYIVDGSFTRLIHNSWNTTPNWFKEALPASLRRSRPEIDLRHTQTSMPPNEQT